MAQTLFAGLVYPTAANADDVPADLMALAESLDTCVVLRANDDADRTLRYVDAPSGVLCVYPNGTVSVKIGSSGNNLWQDVWRPVEAWKALPFTSGYKDWDSGAPCQYRKDRQGMVHARGPFTTTNGTSLVPSSTTAIAKLPPGYRPSRLHSFGSASRWETEYLARIDVDTDGSIRLIGTSTLWAGLDNLHFWLD